jgi:hypothetical protein
MSGDVVEAATDAACVVPLSRFRRLAVRLVGESGNRGRGVALVLEHRPNNAPEWVQRFETFVQVEALGAVIDAMCAAEQVAVDRCWIPPRPDDDPGEPGW